MKMVTPTGERPIGTARHSMSSYTDQGRNVLIFTLEQEVPQGTMVDSLLVDAVTLNPIEYFNSMPGLQTIHTVYHPDGGVRANLERGPNASQIDTLLAGPHLDAASFTSLLPALPLKIGLDETYPAFHYEVGVVEHRVQVPGEEEVSTCRGPESAWIVDVTTPITTTRHWISKADGHIVQVRVDMGGGTRFEQDLVCTAST